jgi:predicted Zn finger-like uncharacterized protein
MHIVCPHCTTSYAIDLAALGTAGRNVRCSRCKETWLARPEDVVKAANPMVAAAASGRTGDGDDAAAEWDAMAREDDGLEQNAPVVDSPSISADWPEAAGRNSASNDDWATVAGDYAGDSERRRSRLLSKLRGLSRVPSFRLPRLPRLSANTLVMPSFAGLPAACAAMGALVLALIIWRADVVRLLPQTAAFYQLIGLDVNLRGLNFKDVKITRETVEGKPVLVIEGMITGETRKTVELPRLRFGVLDAQGTEVYAWNAVLDQQVLKPGEKAWFKSRLASPPPEGRQIDIRFFNKHDIAGGSA